MNKFQSSDSKKIGISDTKMHPWLTAFGLGQAPTHISSALCNILQIKVDWSHVFTYLKFPFPLLSQSRFTFPFSYWNKEKQK